MFFYKFRVLKESLFSKLEIKFFKSFIQEGMQKLQERLEV